MAKINADILIHDSFYEQISVLVEEMQISQSELFTIAIEDYLQRDRLRRVADHRNRKLLQSINEAYEDGLDGSESAILEGMRRHQRHLIEE